MARKVHGQIEWSLSVDEEGYREYSITWLVESEITDGPSTVSKTPGLPKQGATWSFTGVSPETHIDEDKNAYLTREMEVSRHEVDNEPGTFWTVAQKFKTPKPGDSNTSEIPENPLDMKPKISGNFVKYTKSITHQRTVTGNEKSGGPIVNSSWQPITGPVVEFDHNRHTVKIELNEPFLNLHIITPMIDTVNDRNLWGLSKRKIKLSNASWTEVFYGLGQRYYAMVYEFDIDFNTFDRRALDVGTKVLKEELVGQANAHLNPDNFEVYTDDKGRTGVTAILNGAGQALSHVDAKPANFKYWCISHYPESNFLELGIPSSLGIVETELTPPENDEALDCINSGDFTPGA